MRKKLNAIMLLVLSALLSCGTGCANLRGLAIGGKVSTLGLGAELATGVADNVNARVGVNMLDLDLDEVELDDVEYDLGIDFFSFSALVDWHVFYDSFRITAGVVSMNHEIDLDAKGKPGETEEIGGSRYDWTDIGTLSGNADFDDLAPYVGIGWGDLLDPDKRVEIYFDFGVAFIGSPDVKLNATGPTVLPADLQKEQDELEDDLDFGFYPVLSTGLVFRF